MKILNKINKNEVVSYENLINNNFLIENNLHSKRFNINKLVKVAKVTMKNGKTKDVYDYMRTTKHSPGTQSYKGCMDYLKLYKMKVDKILTPNV